MFKFGTIWDLVHGKRSNKLEESTPIDESVVVQDPEVQTPKVLALPEHTIDIGKTLEVFSRRDLETGVQLFLHLQNTGFTFQDLIAYIKLLRQHERENNSAPENVPLPVVEDAHTLSRAEKKHLKARGRRRKNRMRVEASPPKDEGCL